MSTAVLHVEETIKNLSETDFAEFRRWFAEFEAARWDEALERDATNGKLDRMAASALAEYHAGRFEEYRSPKA
jgi:hypothetical protein